MITINFREESWPTHAKVQEFKGPRLRLHGRQPVVSIGISPSMYCGIISAFVNAGEVHIIVYQQQWLTCMDIEIK